jgi:serine/threonine-protein kinase RsbW
MDLPFTLCISADLQNLSAIRQFTEAAAVELQTPSLAIEDLILAIDEAVTNIILHAYQGEPGFIEIEVHRDRDLLLVTLRDQAPPFDPTTVPRPDLSLPLDRRPFGGMGVHLMRESLDGILHRALPGGGNELTLIKKASRSTHSQEDSNEHHG